MLTASISHSEHAYDTSQGYSIEYDQYGAGIVNARAVFETANAGRMVTNHFPANSPANTERVYTFTAFANQRIRVSLTWLQNVTSPNDESHVNYDPTAYPLDDLDLYVIHPEGADIHLSLSIYNNTEIIDFVAPTAGTYQMVVINRLAIERVVNYGLSWWLQPINNLSSSN